MIIRPHQLHDDVYILELYDPSSKQTICQGENEWTDEIITIYLWCSQEDFFDLIAQQVVAYQQTHLDTRITPLRFDGLCARVFLSKIDWWTPYTTWLMSWHDSFIYPFDRYDKEKNTTVSDIHLRSMSVYLSLYLIRNAEWLYNGISKLQSLLPNYQDCHEQIFLDGFYFWQIEKFDKYENTRRRILLNDIKGLQQEHQMKMRCNLVFDEQFRHWIDRKGIKSIVVIPNNSPRKVSFNRYIQDYLQSKWSDLLFLNVSVNDFPGRKIQKSIKGWLCERIENANKLFTLEQHRQIQAWPILIIDDVFGSGATMNAVAKLCKQYYPSHECLWFALLSSFRQWFDVINEV